MRNYRPSTPFNVAMKLLVPTDTVVKGVTKKVFPEPEDGILFFGSYRSFGGTENIANDLYTVYNTATVDTWYNPNIKSDCRVYICETGETFEIINAPENIDLRNQYLRFKIQKIGGKP